MGLIILAETLQIILDNSDNAHVHDRTPSQMSSLTKLENGTSIKVHVMLYACV